MDFVDTAIGDADIILYVTDVVEKADKNAEYIEKLQKVDCPVILVINKIDVSDQAKVVELMGWWQEKLPSSLIIPVSAKGAGFLLKYFQIFLRRNEKAKGFLLSDLLSSDKGLE